MLLVHNCVQIGLQINDVEERERERKKEKDPNENVHSPK